MSHGVTLNGVIGVAIQIRNRMFREAIAAQVDGEPDLRIVGTTAFYAELPRLVELRNPEVVLFEIDPDQGDPAGVVAELRVRHQRLHLVGLYDRPDPEVAERLQLAGVTRLVAYSGGVLALLAAVRPPIGGIAPQSGTLRRAGALMTDRELRILHLISSGYTLGQVATALQITPRTVENYKRRIFAKLDTHSQAHAAAYAVRLGLLPASGEPDARPVSKQTPHAAVALLCGRRGALADKVAEVLLAEEIPLIVDHSNLPLIADHPARHSRGNVIVVLVDPEPADWSAPLDLPSRIMVVHSAVPSQAAMVDAVLRGADALVGASWLAETLLPAFRLVEAGYLLVNAEQARRFIGAGYARLSRTSPFTPIELTRRERQILDSIDRGHSVKQTARALGISVKTVESLQSRLFRKLGIRNRAEALVVAYGLGLVPPGDQELI
ncbi:MAG TPA: LuxR C-terminal-related transcriptional regulator [Streptosporangiaceae bacterium]|jgi:DNA-binding NarL/FixJ family response regulator